jgi:hypothetical protein
MIENVKNNGNYTIDYEILLKNIPFVVKNYVFSENKKYALPDNEAALLVIFEQNKEISSKRFVKALFDNGFNIKTQQALNFADFIFELSFENAKNSLNDKASLMDIFQLTRSNIVHYLDYAIEQIPILRKYAVVNKTEEISLFNQMKECYNVLIDDELWSLSGSKISLKQIKENVERLYDQLVFIKTNQDFSTLQDTLALLEFIFEKINVKLIYKGDNGQSFSLSELEVYQNYLQEKEKYNLSLFGSIKDTFIANLKKRSVLIDETSIIWDKLQKEKFYALFNKK